MSIVEELQQAFLFEPLDEVTIRKMETYLETAHPEVGWKIRREDGRIIVSPQFKTEEDRTFYNLKWS